MDEVSAPRLPLSGRHVVLGVTGSIACYKAADLCSKLRQAGATRRSRHDDRRDAIHLAAGLPVAHWPRSGRRHVHRPRSRGAHRSRAPRGRDGHRPGNRRILSRTSPRAGRPDMVSLTALATIAPVLVAPAMDGQMWEHAATQANVELLASRGVMFVGPNAGRLATGRMGLGQARGDAADSRHAALDARQRASATSPAAPSS